MLWKLFSAIKAKWKAERFKEGYKFGQEEWAKRNVKWGNPRFVQEDVDNYCLAYLEGLLDIAQTFDVSAFDRGLHQFLMEMYRSQAIRPKVVEHRTLNNVVQL